MREMIIRLFLLVLLLGMPAVSYGNLEGWFSDRHPNLAGYRVIADETAKFLTPVIRENVRKR